MNILNQIKQFASYTTSEQPENSIRPSPGYAQRVRYHNANQEDRYQTSQNSQRTK